MSDEDEKKHLEKIYSDVFRDAIIYEKQYPIQWWQPPIWQLQCVFIKLILRMKSIEK